ncbi:hypothetical protein B586_19890 [Mycobacterium haemophilum DSM 44634]|nr:hypothetical protein B586_19890 [Mycobacterium haemophilum DSM 44634]
MSDDPLRPAPPRLRSSLGLMSDDPLRPAPPRLRSSLGLMSDDPLRPAPPRLRSSLARVVVPMPESPQKLWIVVGSDNASLRPVGL